MTPKPSAVASSFPIPFFVLWKWRSDTYHSKYLSEHVETMVYMLTRHGVPLDHIILVTDEPHDQTLRCRTFPLWDDFSKMQNVCGHRLPSCYRRLRLFERQTQKDLGIPDGAPIVSLDLDAVILKDFLPLFNRPLTEHFVGWQVPGVRHRHVLNGSMWMLRATDDLEWVWTNFKRDPQRSTEKALIAGYMGSDQGYLSHNLLHQRTTGVWTALTHGVLAWKRDVVKLRLLRKDARVVFFPGREKPWLPEVRKKSDWILRYVDKPQAVAA